MSNTHPPSNLATEKAWDLFNEQRNQICLQSEHHRTEETLEDTDTWDPKIASIKESLWRNNHRISSSDQSTVESIIAQNVAGNARIMCEISELQLKLNELLEIIKAKKNGNNFERISHRLVQSPHNSRPPAAARAPSQVASRADLRSACTDPRVYAK
ncbi:hypothetical protein H0H81_001845 [Sphagnurus paluster]|uniref:Uncharacterized protein n=1 Tax=Sphagnurus paluster TaxID=117069 RepID=A0A9P7GM40_9AGAR|nr:hypothetical protein H0H81_001845 [Sphagnurus paluster]